MLFKEIKVKRLKVSIYIILLLLIALTVSCTKAVNTESTKTIVTMSHYFEGNFKALETLIETTYPDIDFQPSYSVSESFTSNIERSLRNKVASDLVLCTQPSKEYSLSYMQDLSGNPYCAKYTKSIMDSLVIDGKVYFIPLIGMYQGYLYNKTLFEENGIPIPNDNGELQEAARKLTRKGIVNDYGTSYGIKLFNTESLGYYMMGFATPDFISKRDGINWSDKFLKKEATFSGVWEPLFDYVYTFVDKEVFNPITLDKQRNNVDVLKDLAAGKLAIAFFPEVSIEVIKKVNEELYNKGQAPSLYEYCSLPFFGDNEAPNWVITTPECYIGINANLESIEKSDACNRIMELISTQDGQEAINEEIQGSVSYLKNCDLANKIIPEGIKKEIDNGYVYAVKYPEQLAQTIGKYFIDFMMGKITSSECTALIDDAYYNGNEENEFEFKTVGTMETDAKVTNYNVRKEETEIGNLVTDAIKELTKAQIAVANGGGIRASLLKGDINGKDLLSVCPYDNKIVVLGMSGETLYQMLENSLSTLERDKIPGGRFLQISGASYTFDSLKPIGARLIDVKLSDGTLIDKASFYTVAVNDYMCGQKGYIAGNGDGYTMLNVYSKDIAKPLNISIELETDKTYRDAIISYFANHDNERVAPILEGRIVNVSK